MGQGASNRSYPTGEGEELRPLSRRSIYRACKMTKDDLPFTPTPRPADPFTAQDGLRLFTMIDAMTKRISATLEEQSNRLAQIQRQEIELLNLVKLIEAESADSR